MSIASQLQVIKSVIKGKEDPIRRPITRPSVLFDPKEAADIDLRSIIPLAQSGLDALIKVDDRFSSYKSTLFSHVTLEIEREKMTPKEEEKLNKSICSYLQLLAGQLLLPSALRTLEYLIRRYQVHVFNAEELVLCALPYHDTHAFVRIIQLIDFGNKKWAFLEGVKTSGAPPPRNVIVQQCIRDKGVLEALCNYASSTKDFQHSRPVICFCTAVTVEVLGSLPKLDTDTIQKTLTFVFNGLNPAIGGSPDHAMGALMIVSLMATRATLASKLVQSLVYFIARFAQHDSRKSSDLLRLRVTIMAMVTLVQSQSAHALPKKTIMMLKEIRDFVGILYGLSKEFNIRNFLRLYVESLIDCSLSDDCYHHLLVNVLETLPVNAFVEKIVHKIFGQCMKFLHPDISNSSPAGIRAKQILVVMKKHFPSELQGAVHKFIENSKMKLGEEDSTFAVFCEMLDGNSDVPMKLSDSKVWFSLEHPKAAVRRATLLDLASSGNLESVVKHPWKLVDVKDAIICRLLDDDLTVVQAALSINGLSKIVSSASLLKAYCNVFFRCMDIIKKSSEMACQASDVAVLCLDYMVLDIALHQYDFVKDVAGIIFPVLLVLPQTWRVNVKALELANKLQWPFYSDFKPCNSDFDERQAKSLDHGQMTAINIRTIQILAESFAGNPLGNIGWLVGCSMQSKSAKCFFFFIILQALLTCKEEFAKIWKLFEACIAAIEDGWYEMLSIDNGIIAAKFLKDEWCEVESEGNVIINGELNLERFDKSYRRLAAQLLHLDADTLSNKILICIHWCLLEICTGLARKNKLLEDQQLSLFEQLFLFFASSRSLSIFKKQLPFAVKNCCKAPFQFLSKYFVEEGFSAEVQAESLISFASICSIYASDRSSTNENTLLSLSTFPSLLVPLASDNKEIRSAAVNCVEGIYKLWQCYNVSCLKNGNDAIFLQCVSSPVFGEFLEFIVNQKQLISSDVNFLPSLLTSLLSPSSDSLFVPENSHKRFEQSSKDVILQFILTSALKFPSYGKQKVFSLLKAMGNSLLQIEGCKELLLGLLQKRNFYVEVGKPLERLSENEIDTLCLLLEICAPQSSSSIDAFCVSCLMKALKVDGLLLDEPAVVKPCVTVLKNLTNTFYLNLDSNIQDEIFINLVFLVRGDNGDQRDAAREAVLNLNISCTTFASFLENFCLGQHIDSSKREKREKSITLQSLNTCKDKFDGGRKLIFLLGSLLDIFSLKKDMANRVSLVQPLFEVLAKLFSDDWLLGLLGSGTTGSGSISGFTESFSAALYSARHTTLLILKDTIDSHIMTHPNMDDLLNKDNINRLVEWAHLAKDATTRNHIFLLLSSVAKISSGLLSEHIVDLFVMVGESTIKQSDYHSQQVLENLISVLIPCWLARTRSVGKLFQIFIKGLPDIAENRRMAVIVYLARILGEKDSLGILYYNLFHSLTLRLDITSSYSEINFCDLLSPSSMIFKEWEYTFALQICNQYSSKIWLPSLVKLLREIEYSSKQQGFFTELFLALQFVLGKLRDTEFVFDLESGRDASYIQGTLGALMEQVVLHLQLLTVRGKELGFSKRAMKEIRKCISQILKNLTTWMNPETFFKCIIQLLGRDDWKVIKKTLGLLCEFIKDKAPGQKNMVRTKRKMNPTPFTIQITAHAVPSFIELCSKINQLISSSTTHIPVKLAAISSIETLAKELPFNEPIFCACLQCVMGEINSSDLALSSASIRSTGALVGVLGSQALKQLSSIIKHIFTKVHEVSRCPCLKSKQNGHGIEIHKVPVLLSTLSALEAVITNLGGFLNPYLDDIFDVIILHPEFVSDLDVKLKSKAAVVRKLLTEKIPVRLILPPLLKIIETALRCGESSLSLVFEMLANIIGEMDRSSISLYHLKIYEQCLALLNIRHQVPESVKDINMVEQSVIHTMVVLTMRLTETMFKPLFLHTLEWAESELEVNQPTKSMSLDRSISFYSLVNKLIQQHRSLFVPYFKYLLGSSTRYLSIDEVVDSSYLTQKRKKAKIQDSHTSVNAKVDLSAKLWHLRALILKAFYHCFLYDTIDSKFLDASNFQVLLKPIISQLDVEPPSILNDYPDLPTVEDVDEHLVLCLGQMAVTAKSDVLWKPLNHEVLMQTRNEKVRPKILGLRVIKYLVEHLREEYLVFLAETIPFLGELLEDVELPVKTLAQDILKEMEILSGESLKQYL
ncbi:uncharacterized protein At3g06530 isoform X2 [Phalaenopsis equestris]|uniref:uncharacterized protein At3g06530 isoform X2 n=1 Tax=Phalaenopsis equestris TaxID=78828 RepID=UPI0009E56E4C|nr:uncharacterized protein At3g06530 isoform X2 [Phalaenopsis equestris]